VLRRNVSKDEALSFEDVKTPAGGRRGSLARTERTMATRDAQVAGIFVAARARRRDPVKFMSLFNGIRMHLTVAPLGRDLLGLNRSC
jgi:hypothetical protein